MPMPTAGLLNKPLMTTIFFLSGSSGCSDLLSFISAPLPRAHQWLPLMPLPMNITAKRFGNTVAAAADCDGAAHASDSSHGSAIVTPTPRRTVRLEMDRLMPSLLGAGGTKLRARHDAFDDAVETVAVAGQRRAHRVDRGLVRQHQAAVERIREQLARQVVHKVVLPMRAEVVAQTRQSVSARAAGEGGRRVDGPAAQILGAALTHGSIALEHQPERIKPRMTARATRVLAMTRQQRAERQIEFRLVTRKLRHDGGRRRNPLSKNVLHHPIAALDRAGPKARRVPREKDAHRQQPAAAEWRRVDLDPRSAIDRRHAVVLGQRCIHERVVRVQKVKGWAIVPHDVEDEPDRLFEHRFAKFVRE